MEANENFWKSEEPEMNESSTRRESATGSRVFKLYRCEPGLCNGSNTCNRGRVGVACGRCPDNHALETGVCVECNMARDPQELTKWRAVFGIVLGLFASVVWFLFGWTPLFGGTALTFLWAWFAWCVVVHVVMRVSHNVFLKTGGVRRVFKKKHPLCSTSPLSEDRTPWRIFLGGENPSLRKEASPLS